LVGAKSSRSVLREKKNDRKRATMLDRRLVIPKSKKKRAGRGGAPFSKGRKDVMSRVGGGSEVQKVVT